MRQLCTTLRDLPWPVMIHTHINSVAGTRRCVSVRRRMFLHTPTESAAKLPGVSRLVRPRRDRVFYQLLRCRRHLFQIAEDQHQFPIAVVFDHLHIRLAKRLVSRQQRLEVLGPEANEHFAPVPGVAHALDKSLLFQPVEDVRDCSGGQAGQVRKPTSRNNAFGMKPDQAQAPGIGGIQSDRLRECLMQQNRLRAEFSGEISQPPQHFRFFRRLGQISP